ncbi:MAG: glycoside hydrolase family 15 protein [Thermoplasmatota archaeon]
MTVPIAEHGLISDGESAALVEPNGDIVWWCTPRFDSPPACDALLGGRRKISLHFADATVKSFAYEPETNVLVTEWQARGFVARVHDFMPYPPRSTSIVRIARVETGVGRLIVGSSARYELRASDALETRDRELRSGESVAFVIGPGETAALGERQALRARDDTMDAWRSWARRCTYEGPHRGLVVRSLLALKALEYRPTGAIIAAPTTSLPEERGGERNWDYRYAWLRDTGFCMDAFVSSGYDEDARGLASWVLRTVAETPGKDLRIMYGVAGGPAPDETRADLPGYAGSTPVRFGNNAVHQFQLDAYGHIMDCLHLWQGFAGAGARDVWRDLVELVERCREVWRAPDHGIWELATGRRQHTYSKVMAWVAFDRAVKAARKHDLPAPISDWERTREEIRKTILRDGVDATTGAFTQSFGDASVDASSLRIPIVGFLPPRDPRVLATLAEVERRLKRNGILLRYANDDGLAGQEGAFLACSFWLVEALALAGRLAEARALFDHLATLAGPLGLYAEECDPVSGVHLGNYPQAFTHASLVSAAWQLVAPASTQVRGEHEGAGRHHRAPS